MKRIVSLKLLLLFLLLSIHGFLEAAESNFQAMHFVPNRGQIVDLDGNARPDVLFKASASSADIYLTKNGLSFVLVSLDQQEEGFSTAEEEMAEKMRMLQSNYNIERIDYNFVGISPNFEVEMSDMLGSVEHYYFAHCPDGITNVPACNTVTFKGIYPGIDWQITCKEGKLKSTYFVAPNVDPQQIRIQVNGAQGFGIGTAGQFHTSALTGEIEDERPIAFQNGQSVEAGWKMDMGKFGFELGQYDPGQALVIDPYTRIYSTFFGGSGNEWYLGHCTTTDLSGNMYLAGHTGSVNFPVTAGMFQVASAGSNDCFLGKFDNNGVRLWSTYYGGSSSEGGIAFKIGISPDAFGNIWIATSTASTNFPVTAGCFQPTFGGTNDAALVKFSSAGTRLYATFFGGSGTESPGLSRWGANSAPAIASDANGNIFMTGYTQSTNLPVTAGCFQSALSGTKDAYLVKWTNAGAMTYCSYLGGSGLEESAAAGIAVDVAGNVWTTGCTGSTNFPTTPGAFQTTFGGVWDQYLVKWSNNCNMLYSTYYGGSNDEGVLCDVDVTTGGQVWLGIFTQSSNLPVTGNANQFASAGGWDFAVAQFDNSGNRLYASYFGSSNQEEPWDISVSKVDGRVCIVGATWGSNIPTMGPPFQSVSGGGQEGAIIVLDPTGLPIYSTYYGSSGHDEAFSSIFDIYGNVWVSGMAAAATFPVTAGAFQTVFAGSTDPWLAKFVPPVILGQDILDLRLAAQNGKQLDLEWTVDPSLDAAQLVLERDMEGSWQPVYSTEPNSNGTYRHSDVLPYEGMAQYRIVAKLQDGTLAYSNMLRVMVAISQDELIAAYPNPVEAGEEVFLQYQMMKEGEARLEVSDITGKLVLSKEFDLPSGRSNIDFSTNAWAAGTYMVRLSSANGESTLKIQVR